MISTGLANNNVSLKKRIHQLGAQVGNTPLYQIKEVFSKNGVAIYAKKEWEQLGGSVKARAAYQIIRAAVESGELDEEKILLDATSGNTGIAYATIANAAGIKVTLCLPENASEERKKILTSLGVNIVYTSRFEGTDGGQEIAREMVRENPGKFFYADQYKNANNWKAHYFSTANEIYETLPAITHFVAGLGTTGTFIGAGRRLKELSPSIHLTALQPDSALHGLEGWKHLETAIVPAIYDPSLADEILEVSTEEAYEMIKLVNRYEGLRLSPSAAANLAGAIKVAEKSENATIVTVFPDNAEKYSDVINKLI